jgi:hypothetical protein
MGEAWTRWSGADWYGRWQLSVLEPQSAVKTLHAHCMATCASYHYQYHQIIWKSYEFSTHSALLIYTLHGKDWNAAWCVLMSAAVLRRGLQQLWLSAVIGKLHPDCYIQDVAPSRTYC